jgi:hypothetical protein
MANGKGKKGDKPRKAMTAAKKATRSARMAKSSKISKAKPKQGKPKQMQQRPAQCGARDEHTLEACKLEASKDGYCDEHSTQWNRSEHLRAGMPTPTDDDDAIANFDTCGKLDCDEADEALECEACPFTYHPNCAPQDSRLIKNSNGEQVFVCGTCVNDASKWSMIPHALREPATTKKRPKADAAAVDAFLDKASPEKKSTDRDVSKRRRSDAQPTDRSAKDQRRAQLLEQLEALDQEEDDEEDMPFIGDSDDDDVQDLTPTAKPDIKTAIAKSLSLQDSLQHNRRFAHIDNQCNDPECKINRRDGQFDFNAGDRIDGAYESLALELFGPSSCFAWSSSQRPKIEAEQKQRGCSKPSFNKPVFATCEKLSDSQVNTYLEDTVSAYTSLARERATLGYACQTRLDLIANVATTAAAVRTILTRPDTYGAMSAQDYVRTLLELAHRGADIQSGNIHGIPRHDVTSCLSLRKSAAAAATENPGVPDNDAQKNNNGGGGNNGNKKQHQQQSKRKKRCYNCEKHGVTRGDTDHDTGACPKPWKLQCGINGCTETHRRKDHK